MPAGFVIPDPDALQSAASSFSKQALTVGRKLAGEGKVLTIAEQRPGKLYQAIVRDVRNQEVSLAYESGKWAGSCSCTATVGCGHIVAAMLSLLREAAELDKTLTTLLTKTLKRPLKAPETDFLQKLSSLFHRWEQSNFIADWDVNALIPGWGTRTHNKVVLWPTPPADVVELWHYLALESKTRGLEIPTFMKRVEIPSKLEERYKAWTEQQVIDQWTREFRKILSAETSEVVSLADLRLVIEIEPEPVAKLEWRRAADQPFQPLRGNSFKTLLTALQEQTLPVSDASLPLAQFLIAHARIFASGILPLNDRASRKVLHPLIASRLLEENIVTTEGRPFKRDDRPLRWDVAATENGEYQLRLVHPALEKAQSLTPFPGRPSLYVGSRLILTGPAPLGDGNFAETEKRIPRIAIETREGLEFLQRLGAALPKELGTKVKRCKLAVRIECIIDPLFAGSANDALFIQVVASNTECGVEESLTKFGWIGPASARGDSLVQIDRTLQEAFPGALEPLGTAWDPVTQRWKLRITKQFPERFVEWARTLPTGVDLQLTGELSTLLGAPVQATVRLECQPDEERIDWFNIRAIVDVDDTELTADEVRTLLDARGEFVRLPGKGWRRLQFKLTPEEEQRLAEFGLDPSDLTSEPQQLHALQLEGSAASSLLPEQQFAQIRDRARALKLRVAPEVPATVEASLRPYQVEGFHFLCYLAANHFGGILADDMGLGKTLQTLTWMAWLRETHSDTHRPILVVCPKSVMENWRSEAARFVPSLRVLLGSKLAPEKLKEMARSFDLVVINYSQLRQISTEPGFPRWLAVILDEGQYIKNPESQTAKAACSVDGMFHLVLTGTPVENRLLDLWSLMSFAMPGLLPPKGSFLKSFDVRTDPLARKRLAARVRPFLLRRTKKQVAPELPERVEEDLLFEMEEDQKNLYLAELKRAQQMLLRVTTLKALDAERMNFLASLLRLRQICCHPALLPGIKQQTASAKLEAFADIVEPLIEEGHKVLVFSQFVSMLELIRQEAQTREWPTMMLTGETENRGDLVANFQSREDACLFLISLKAGGFGLNLTAASYVILFDPWWNPAVENQAIDRTHRIGQENKVLAYRLLIKDSVEEKIRHLQQRKNALARDILGEEAALSQLTLEDFRFLFDSPESSVTEP